jgi:hypothetical protein
MSELTDLVGIYGAIDRAVAESPERRAAVARLMPVYRDPDAQWFDEFEAWTAELAPRAADPPFPSLEEALGDLAAIPAQRRMRARRLFNMAVATQAFPELLEHPHWSDLAVGALRVEGLAPDDDHARRLLAVLNRNVERDVEGETPGDLDTWWQNLLGEAFPGLIPAAEGIGHRPCSGRIVRGPLGAAAALETYFERDDIPFDKAIRLLDPVNWPHCNGFWCEMTPQGEVAPGIHRYHEVVSLDCDRQHATWTIEAELDFTFRKRPGRAVTEYRLSPGAPQPDVVVDEGSLVVAQIDPADASRLAVTTTKRIRFNRRFPFSGEPLAMVMCLLGYASVAEDLFECAASGALGTEFPAEPPATTRTTAGAGRARMTTAGAGARSGTVSGGAGTSAGRGRARPDPGPLIKDIADRYAVAVKDCIDDYVDAAQDSYEAIADGRYTANHLVQDMANMWVRMLRDSATAVDLAIRSAQMAPRTGPRKPSQS